MKYPHSLPTIDQSDIQAVTDVLKSNHLEDGDLVDKFETTLANYIGRKYAVATVNGFAAIHLALIALGIKESDEVIIPSYSCPAILNPILHLHAKPGIVDVEANGFNIDAQNIERSITKKTKAIIVPHTFGFPAKIDKIKEFNIPIIEDCAQAIGGIYNGIKLGGYTDISIFSFYATKLLTAGDAGMILTDNKDYLNIIQNYKYYGHKRNHKYLAYNYHIGNLPAALGISQLKKIDAFIKKRGILAKIYDEQFSNNKSIFNQFNQKDESIFFRYPILIENKKGLMNQLKEMSISTGHGVLEGLHNHLGLDNKSFTNTNKFLEQIISLPIYPSLEEEDIMYISRAVKNSGVL